MKDLVYVHCLTVDESNLALCNCPVHKGEIFHDEAVTKTAGAYEAKHIYMTTSRQITDTCWCLDEGKEVRLYQKGFQIPQGYRRILAATDPKLRKLCGCGVCDAPLSNIGLIPVNFISYFMQEYNNNNLVSRTYIESNSVPKWIEPLTTFQKGYYIDVPSEPILNKQGFITWSKYPKDIFTIDEVREMTWEARKSCYMITGEAEELRKYHNEWFDNKYLNNTK